MALRALFGENNILAFEQTEASWEALRQSPERRELTMPCCGTRAIAKTSPLGNYFFAHYRKAEDCNAEPESKEHIYLKGEIAKAAKLAGWEVTTEYPGSSPCGETWVADVFCQKKRMEVALEIQLSKQSLHEFQRRQERYRRSVVRAAWFVSEPVATAMGYPSSEELPFFVVENYQDATPIPTIKGFELGLLEFVSALMKGKVSWKEDPAEAYIYYLPDHCWSCGSPVKQPYGYGDEIFTEEVKTVPNCSTVLKEILSVFGNDTLASRGINKVASHPQCKGNAPGYPFCSECIHCGKPQTNYYLMEKLKAAYQSGNYQEQVEAIPAGTCNGRWEIQTGEP